MTRNPPETAPKDRLILADFGLPWLVLTHWNAVSECWAFTSLSLERQIGDKADYLFETEHGATWGMRGWLKVPKITRKKKP